MNSKRKIYRIGEKNINKQGLQMVIINYRDRHNIDVKFDNGYIVNETTYMEFCNGSILNPLFPSYLNKGFLGIGEYKTRENNIKTSAYVKWGSMLTRCYSSKYKEITYQDCFVCDEWLNYQNFAKWHYENYYLLENERVELDKDILERDNKEYCPQKCMYVPHKINSIICNRSNNRGKYAIGVSQTPNGKFISNCNINGKTKYLGLFTTELEAFLAYKKAKESEICRLAETYRGKIPDKVIETIQQYKVRIKD